MNERNWERLGALSGIAFVVLVVVGGFLYPQQPRVDSSAATTLAWVHGHRTAIQTGMVLGVFGLGAFVWFVGYLRHVLDRTGDDADGLPPVVLGSGIGVAVMGTLGLSPLVVLAFMDAQPGGLQDATIVRMLGDLTSILFGIGAALTAVFVLAVGAAMVRRALLPAWFAWLSVVAAVLNAVAVVTSMTFSTYHGVGWSVPGWGAFFGGVIVVLIASVTLLRRPAVDLTRTERAVRVAS